jgi:hypothetical protein
MYHYFKAALLLLSLISLNVEAQQLPNNVSLRVVIIRHGEKPATGNNLSCAGLNRAMALPRVLDTVTGKPDFTYVPEMNTGKKTTSVRMFQTITPFAVAKNLVINSKYKETDTVKVAQDILMKKGIVLMVWEHSNIPALARCLGVKGNLEWKGQDFDSIWVIDYSKSDSKGKMTDPIMAVKQQKIKPSNTCGH